MGNDRLVSVIVPAYQHEAFVGDALRSLVAQTHSALELIVIDDGSHDGTYDNVEALRVDLLDRFSRVHLERGSHVGGAANVSRCLESAASDLVYILDSDDIADPTAIACLLPILDDERVALAVGDNRYIDEHGGPYSPRRGAVAHETLIGFHTADRPGFVAERDFGTYETLIRGNYVPNGWLVRKSAVAAVGGYPTEFVLDDWPLLLKLARQFRIAYAGTTLGSYRVHDRNNSSRQSQRLVCDTIRILLNERQWCRERGLEEPWWEHLCLAVGSLTATELEDSDLTNELAVCRPGQALEDVQTLAVAARRIAGQQMAARRTPLAVLPPPPPAAHGQRIHLYALTWNDARLLPFFFRHYDQWVQRYVIYDDSSDDDTLAVLSAHPRVEVRRFNRSHSDSFVLSERSFYQECWKESRETADWIFLVDVDEHLDHPDLGRHLAWCQSEGVTAVPALGFEMIAEAFPLPDERLAHTQRRGAPSLDMCKLSIFAPAVIADLRPEVGGHSARPLGALLPPRDEVRLLHYKYLGLEYALSRHQALERRLGPTDRAAGWGRQWSMSPDEQQDDLDRHLQASSNVDTAATRTFPTTPWWVGVLPRVENRAELEAAKSSLVALQSEYGTLIERLARVEEESVARARYLTSAEEALTVANAANEGLSRQLDEARARVTDIQESRTWRWTAGLRRLAAPFIGTTQPIAGNGKPDLQWPSPVALIRDLASHGRIGRYVWYSRQIVGWTRDLEAPAVAGASYALPGAPVIVEIGCFLGCATVLLAGARKLRGRGHIHCIDPFDGSGDVFSVPVYRTIAASLTGSLRETFDHNVRRAGVARLISVHQTTAALAATTWATPIDLLYLDGDVSREGARDTYLAWERWLRRGGTLILSSTQTTEQDHDGPMHVVQEFIRPPAYEDIRQVDGITLARKT